MLNKLDLNTKLTLKQFIDLFNDENENYFWDMFRLQIDDEHGVQIVSRNKITIS